MNVAFQALALFILLLPGLAAQKVISNSAKFLHPRTLADEVAHGLLTSIVIHAVLTQALTWWSQFAPWLLPDPGAAMMIVMGQFGKNSEHLDECIGSVTDNPLLVAGYVIMSTAVGAVYGVVRSELTKRFQVVRKLAEWFDDDNPTVRRFENWCGFLPIDVPEEELVLPCLSVIVNVCGKPHIYFGILRHVSWGTDGNPDTFFLTNVIRKPFEDVSRIDQDEDASETREDEDEFYEVEGNGLAISISDCVTVNVVLLALSSDDDEDDDERVTTDDASGTDEVRDCEIH